MICLTSANFLFAWNKKYEMEKKWARSEARFIYLFIHSQCTYRLRDHHSVNDFLFFETRPTFVLVYVIKHEIPFSLNLLSQPSMDLLSNPFCCFRSITGSKMLSLIVLPLF